MESARRTYDWLAEIGWDAGYAGDGGCGGYYWEVSGAGLASDSVVEAVAARARSSRGRSRAGAMRRGAAPRAPNFGMAKNGITNLEMLQAAAQLHRLTGNATYRAHAERTWSWLTSSGMVREDGMLSDGVTGEAGAQTDCCNGTSATGEKPRCVNNHATPYTYVQGMFVGAAALLFSSSGGAYAHDAYIAPAERALGAVLGQLTRDGVLTEAMPDSSYEAARPPCVEGHDPADFPTGAGGDHYSFKGVFALQLASFMEAAPRNASLAPRLLDVLSRSSDSAWALRAEPPWPSAVADVCADPTQAKLEDGPPKFPWFWGLSRSASAQPRRVCRDARTQISALSLFVAHERALRQEGRA